MHPRFAVRCALLLAACAALPAAAKVPLSSFVVEDQYSKPVLSPDGKYIAITVRVPSRDRFVPVVTIYTLPDMKIASAIRMPAGQVPLGYAWIGKTRLAVVKGEELGARERPVFYGEVLATDVDGRNQDYLFGYSTFNSSRAGARYGYDQAWGYVTGLPATPNSHFYLTAHMWRDRHSMLYDIDSTRAVRKLLADLPETGLTFVMQHDGAARFAFGASEDNKAVLYRYRDASASWEKQDSALPEMRYFPAAFSADNSEFVAYHSPNGGPRAVIRENLASGARSTVFADARGDAGALMVASRNELPFGVTSVVGVPAPHYFDPNSRDAQLHQQLAAQFPGSTVTFTNQTDDGNTLLFIVASDRDPGSFYLLDKRTMKAKLLFMAMEKIDPDEMAERRPIAFKARDGLELDGYLTMPKHAAGAKPPMVLLPHGGPHGVRDAWYFNTDAQFLASRGYAVLQVNFRGSGGRGATFRDAGYRQWSTTVQDDLVDGARWAIAQGEVDGNRVCAYGISFGAYSAMLLAAREPALFKCAVGYAGAYDLNLIFQGEHVQENKKTFNYFARSIGQDKDELARASPVSVAAQITSPVLLVHGGKDETTPPAHAEAMRAALVKANHPPQWLYMPNEGHGFYDTENITRFYETLEAFLDKHIGH